MRQEDKEKATVLIVDNDQYVHLLVEEILKNENYRLEHAMGGSEALEMLGSLSPDLILLDIMMPEMDGFEVCQRLQENNATRSIPVVFLSARYDDATYRKGYELGAVDFLTKPVKMLDLVLKTRNYIKLFRNEKKLKENELRYRMLADYNYDWEYWLSPENEFLYVSPSCERITGYAAEEFIERPSLVYEIAHPDYRDILKDHYFRKTSEGFGQIEMLEYIIIDKNGNEKWIHHICNPVFDDNKKYRGVRGNNRDVTSRKSMEQALVQSEKKFRNIFESSSDYIIISDSDMRILTSNPAFRELVSVSPEELKKSNIINFISPKDIQPFIGWYNKVAANELYNSSLEIRLINEHRIFEIKSRLIDYQEGTAVLSNIRDITERKEMHNRILNTIINTEEKERRRFAQDLHDGMGPLLSTIKLYTRSVLTVKEDEKKAIALEKSLDTIDEAISCIKEISNNISPSILKDFGLAVAVKSFVNKFKDTRRLNINFRSNLKKRVDADIETSFFRIINELVNNTLKHAHASNAMIGLRYSKKHLYLDYSDDGIGCDLDEIMDNPSGQGITNIINRARSVGGDISFNTAINKGFNVNITVETGNKET